MNQPNFDDVPRPSLKILTPAYGGVVTTRYFHSILNLGAYLMRAGINFTVETLPNCSLISLGRSIMIHRALQDPNWTHVLWIDSDIEFDPRCVHSMLAEDRDIIGGFYPKKGLPIDMASSPSPGGEEDEGTYETIYCATGFLLEKRHVIERMREEYREEYGFSYQGGDEYVDLFPSLIDKESNNRLYLTEDYAHCKLAQKLGFKTYMSKRFSLNHWGTFCFSKHEEENMLRDYERMGYIEIKQMYPDWEKINGSREDAGSPETGGEGGGGDPTEEA